MEKEKKEEEVSGDNRNKGKQGEREWAREEEKNRWIEGRAY